MLHGDVTIWVKLLTKQMGMRFKYSAFLIVLVALSMACNKPPVASGETWEMVWQDEFNGNALDSSNWSHSTGGDGFGNQELQYYTPGNNLLVKDGVLRIIAFKENRGSNPYTSAKIQTQHKQAFQYGKIEARLKLPRGRGTWPAFWMMPQQNNPWPGCGEIDVMEHVGHREGYVHGTVHTESYNHLYNTQRGSNKLVADACDVFHIYSVEWNADSITWRIDEQPFFTFVNEGTGVNAWPFNKPFYLILNLAIGGTWGGAQGVDNTIFPVDYQIDWVRVWKKKG
jgi:beta-glucanase (GH16 family)